MSQHWYDSEGNLVSPYTKGSYPSVTTIQDIAAKDTLEDAINRMGAERFAELMDFARERGTRIHKAVEDLSKGVTPDYIQPGDVPFIDGYINWKDAIKPTILHSELFLVSEKYKYAGTADIIAAIDGVIWLIDVKTTSMHKKEHGIQLKAYQQAYYEMTGIRPRMAVLKLTDKTKKGWQWKEYNEPLRPFLALLDYFKWTVRKRKVIAKEISWSPEDVVVRV